MTEQELKNLSREQIVDIVDETLRRKGEEPQELLVLADEVERRHLYDLEESLRAKEARDRAWRRLRQPGGEPGELFALAKELKSHNLFGAARRVLQRARKVSPAPNLKLVQELALCTYKDPTVPAHEALDEALHILRAHADLADTRDPETLGLTGAIFKRKWQTDGDKQHLESSLAYYQRGYNNKEASESERGYTGINAAYVLDLLAHVEDEQAQATTNAPSPMAARRRKESRRIREEIVELFGPIDEGDEESARDWWWYATLAEAHFGLGIYDAEADPEFLTNFEGSMDGKQTVDEDSHYAKALGTVLTGVMIHALTPDSGRSGIRWELESTARQFASLAQLQVGTALQAPAWQVIEGLVGDATKALVGSVFGGKLGIGLSGGGFRASLFHIGFFARLAELDLLRHVEVLSGVSGGSIFGAYYYLKVRRLLQDKEDEKITRDDYVRLVREMADEFLAGVQRNMRTRVPASILGNLKMAFRRSYSRSDRLAELYEKEIYALAGPEKSLMMDRLGITPAGSESFSPERENWQRRNKIPNLVLNATTLNTGHNWQFTTSSMGESAFAVDDEIDGNWLLRRMEYHDAPPEHRKIPLGKAVGASACVPGLFEPIIFEGLYPKDPAPGETKRHPEIVVRLVDGGVHDNQGAVSLLEQDCSVIMISDASGQMGSEADAGGSVLATMGRMNSILMERVRQAQFQDLKARHRAGLLKALMIVHMKKAFDVEPIEWKGCDDPPEEREAPETDLLPYGLRKELQAMLASVRTDLDSFSDIEAHALMTSGYLMAKQYTPDLGPYLKHAGATEPEKPVDWKFREVEKTLSYDSDKGPADDATVRQRGWVRQNLATASKGAARIFSLSKPLRVGVKVLAILALAALVLPALLEGSLVVNLVVVGLALGALAIVFKGRHLVKIAVSVALGFLILPLARLQLWFIDPWLRRLGRLRTGGSKKA